MLSTKERLALAVMCCGLAACGGGGTGGTGTTGSTGSGGAGGGGGTHAVPCDKAPAELALAGTWAVTGKLAVKLQGAPGGAITICPVDQVGEAAMLILLTIQQDAADPLKLPEVHASLCSIELPTVTALVGSCDPSSPSLVYTQLAAPQAFLDALPKVVTMPSSAKLDGKQAGAGIAFDRFTVTVGSKKGGDLLPKWDTASAACTKADVGHTTACDTTCVSDCPALSDDDGDGYPGVTLDVCGLTASDQKKMVPCHADHPDDPGATLQGRAFLDIQVDPQLSGTVKSSCEMEGAVDAATQILYEIVGTEVWLANTSLGVAQAIGSLPSFTVDSPMSRFRVVRIDGQYGAPDFQVDPTQPGAACAAIIKKVNEL